MKSSFTLIVSAGLGAAIYLAAVKILKVSEIDDLILLLKKKLKKA